MFLNHIRWLWEYLFLLLSFCDMKVLDVYRLRVDILKNLFNRMLLNPSSSTRAQTNGGWVTTQPPLVWFQNWDIDISQFLKARYMYEYSNNRGNVPHYQALSVNHRLPNPTRIYRVRIGGNHTRSRTVHCWT